jgi:hypothetical protein
MRSGSLVIVMALTLCSGTAAQQRVRNPHGKLDEECAFCHSAEAWSPARVSARFDHAKKGFALVGAHSQAACRSCHASLDFRGAASSCTSCHEDIHRGELGSDCARCHTPRNFLDRSVMARSHRLTRFPLSGTHLTVDCEACHTPAPQGRMAFVNVPTQCVACHQVQFQAARNPDHVTVGFPETCQECHAPTTWSAARFNHESFGFALTGMHRSLTCEQCHGSGGFTGASAACASCHQQDYDATADPNHLAASFPTTCQTCHTTSGWTGAAFNHSWFRLPHRDADCADCHTSPANYAVFVCTNCHTQSETDREHRERSGYTWDSAACYRCHPRGD